MTTILYRDKASGHWIVEWRHMGDVGWRRVGSYATQREARAALHSLSTSDTRPSVEGSLEYRGKRDGASAFYATPRG